MAEISQSSSPSTGGTKIRSKKHSVKIDMTPMVDLAFLLLTFFILTTTFKDKFVLQLDMPDKVTDVTSPPLISADKVLNLVLAENNKLYWWTGFEKPKLTNYSKDGVRKILLEKGQSIPQLMVLIMPMDNSKYENMVDILDEVAITNTARYAIVDFSEDDRSMLELAQSK